MTQSDRDPPASPEPREPPFYGTGEILCWDAQALCIIANHDPLIEETAKNDLVEARGYYGFFPVITEADDVVILDPVDFHTERAVLHSPGAMAKCLRPEGDVLAVMAVTLGGKLQDGEAGKNLCALLLKRLATEVRRALFMAADEGRLHPLEGPVMQDREGMGALLDLMCAEDRLGITISSEFCFHPHFSSMAIFTFYSPVANGEKDAS